MTDKIEVTQADREAYLSMNMLPEFDAIDVRAGLWDKVTGLQSFARHAHAARIEGARAALEAAATELECREDEMDPNSECCGIYAVSSYAIRALDPEQIVKGMSQ